ncbi:MAG: DUF502 domain-containing protein [Myxococcota bacterium]|nr:DUF502 domain-containing protein [Myxococcales bacterium]
MASGPELRWDSMLTRLWHGLREATRRYFVAGLLAFAPLAITFWAISWAVKWLDNLLLPRLVGWIFPSVAEAPHLPPFVGALFTFGVILLAGVFVRHFFGHQIVRLSEQVLERVPVARSIYAAVKQLFEAVFRSEETARNFNRVVLVEYPRKGVYALAFTTGPAEGALADAVGDGYLNVFVPTTPNPTSGFFLLARREEIVEIDLPVEEAFKVIMSAGIVQPPSRSRRVATLSPEVVARAVGD